jgi:hypothetical protein
MMGTSLKPKFPDSSQGPTLEAGLLRIWFNQLGSFFSVQMETELYRVLSVKPSVGTSVIFACLIIAHDHLFTK